MRSEGGYRGLALRVLKKHGVNVGDEIKVVTEKGEYVGILMPRSELEDDEHIVIKLENGYNIGIKISEKTVVEKIGEVRPRKPLKREAVAQREALPLVCLIGTGGTIASRIDYKTGAVYPSFDVGYLLRMEPRLSEVARIEARELFNVFSEDMLPKHWSAIAEGVAKEIKKGAQGVVIAHGTDTMGYTAAALSFALQNLPVPVVLVGAQRSSDRPSTDAVQNLYHAVLVAAMSDIAEVGVLMHESTSDTSSIFIRGVRTRKMHTSRRDAFKSVNFPPLARVVGNRIQPLVEDYNRRGGRSLVLKNRFSNEVALVKFYPGMDPSIFEFLADRGYKGVVLEGTGLGHVGSYLFDGIKRLIESGALVVMTSQCLNGRVNMNVYRTGRILLSLGVVPGEDILPETAYVKLCWIFGQTSDLEKAKELFTTNIAGEFCERSYFSVYGW